MLRPDPADPAGPGRQVPAPAVNRTLAGAGLGAVVLSALLLGSLHVLPPASQLSATRRTISQYALLEVGWVFDLAVLLLAAGSVAVLAALVGTRLATVRSGGALALVLWSVSLAAVVVFPKHDWSVGPSLHGHVHRLAGLVAFVSMPVAAVLISRGWLGHPLWARYARAVIGSAVLALLFLSPIVVAYLTGPWTGIAWWRAVPLGMLERLLGLGELVAVLLLGGWAFRAAGRSAG